MRIFRTANIALAVALTGAVLGSTRVTAGERGDGRAIFRFDTFGDQQLWTNVLRMHEVLPSVPPATALAVGLKVDAEALPPAVIAAIRRRQLDLNDPAVTLTLLKLNAVIGVTGTFDRMGRLATVGVTCALCHSTVDDSVAHGIGRRLDGWPNRDLNAGAIASLSPALDDATRQVFQSWGPGKYDARHHIFDGTNIIPLDGPTIPVLIPPIYGMKGVDFETYTGDGPVSYWNRYVGVTQMGGHGTFVDPRIGVAVTQTPDLVGPKLRALVDYELSLRTPKPSPRTFDARAAARGRKLFRDDAGCASCHRAPHFTDVNDGNGSMPRLHDAAEVGVEPVLAARSATGAYRTTPLRALASHAPYFHDGSAATLEAVVDHYDALFHLGLTPSQKADLVEYLKSL